MVCFFSLQPFSISMSDHKTPTLHVPSPLDSVVNTLSNPHHQKVESIDYTADESMIAVSEENICSIEQKIVFFLLL